ncbi:polyprenyl synthetase family protein [Tessaracoccus palaemonis]|uniref:Polyprenyl synthetase family protein n=1 Tax=Tessaracoccus palaemonis TaxID=2829499 RepID=A0ABX8SG81_9ACTN|nr:polyprenyl synthetase family protein [Tessaracoccus palaemonis]QXT62407.1 polyprenyl synthetase family protein [Tessaracoccus palaemonis]
MSALAREEALTTRQAVGERLEAFFDARSRHAGAYDRHFRQLWDLAYECAFGGKLVRPVLLIDMYDALSNTPDPDVHEKLLDLGAAVELLHFAFLLHDDVIDGDVQRRGRPNLVGSLLADAPPGVDPEAAAHWARSGAILMGDLVLAGMHQLVARVDLPLAQRSRVLDLIDFTITETVAGEYADVSMGDGILSGALPRVLSTTLRKTATYTFELPLRVAATMAGASTATEETLAAVGRQLGLAFQLQDDLLSTFGIAREHGKDRYSDLREGKQTAIIAFARHTDAWQRLEPLLGNPDLSPAQGALASHLLSECGARAFVEQLVDERYTEVGTLLSDGPVPPRAADLIRSLAGQLRDRRS